MYRTYDTELDLKGTFGECYGCLVVDEAGAYLMLRFAEGIATSGS